MTYVNVKNTQRAVIIDKMTGTVLIARDCVVAFLGDHDVERFTSPDSTAREYAEAHGFDLFWKDDEAVEPPEVVLSQIRDLLNSNPWG